MCMERSSEEAGSAISPQRSSSCLRHFNLFIDFPLFPSSSWPACVLSKRRSPSRPPYAPCRPAFPPPFTSTSLHAPQPTHTRTAMATVLLLAPTRLRPGLSRPAVRRRAYSQGHSRQVLYFFLALWHFDQVHNNAS